ncbi:hypothetical protein ABC383_11385 [Noviherbaspirillum sp. 1P10PC]|uniref:hypothetical protein n=1 Tax=Noviherbaspirillum sp. 1P10PC TaxID=3132292 RepID=UPI0039A3A142
MGDRAGGEASAMPRATRTGHGGSMVAVHADSPDCASRRLEGMRRLALRAGPIAAAPRENA